MSASQSVRFLTFDRRITECWAQLGAAVRAAQAVGLHRDPGKMVSRGVCSSSLRNLNLVYPEPGSLPDRVSPKDLVR